MDTINVSLIYLLSIILSNVYVHTLNYHALISPIHPSLSHLIGQPNSNQSDPSHQTTLCIHPTFGQEHSTTICPIRFTLKVCAQLSVLAPTCMSADTGDRFVFLDTCYHHKRHGAGGIGCSSRKEFDPLRTCDLDSPKQLADRSGDHHLASRLVVHSEGTTDSWLPTSVNVWTDSRATTPISPFTGPMEYTTTLSSNGSYEAIAMDEFAEIKRGEPNGNNNNTATPTTTNPRTQRRTSLHGKTITVRVSRNETKYRKLQAQAYNFLERPKTWGSFTYHGFVFASVLTCLILSVLSTIQEYALSASRILLYMELGILFWFFTEYCIRLWSAGCRSRYQTWRGRIHFARRPFCIVDIVVIVASVIVLAVDNDRNMFAASALRGLRFFQILRMIRMDRRGGSFKLLASVVWAHRQELFTTVYIGFLGLIFTSFLIYLVEKKENEKIRTYADALWWGVVTLCTVGYGDTVPRTWMGKLIAAFCSLAGISFFALPAGILGSGFALKVQQHQRQKHLIRRRVPAATLIQCLWRCYAADPNSTSIATWKVHTRPVKKPVGITTSSSVTERGFSRFSRFSTLKRRPDKSTTIGGHSLHATVSPSAASSRTDLERIQRTNNQTSDGDGLDGLESSHKLGSTDAMLALGSPTEHSKLESIEEPMPQSPWFEDQYDGLDKDATLREQDDYCGELKSEQTPQHNKPSSYRSRRYNNNNNTNNRLASVYNRLTANTEVESGGDTPVSRTADVVKSTPVKPRVLTENEKIAIRTVRKIRFLVARRKFREALRPYDVKDVIEQYSAGHWDMLTRVKILQARLDQILGRPGGKPEDVYESHQSLASRIVKIEHKIDTVEMKIDRLCNMYRSDRVQVITSPTAYGHHPDFHLSPISPASQTNYCCPSPSSDQVFYQTPTSPISPTPSHAPPLIPNSALANSSLVVRRGGNRKTMEGEQPPTRHGQSNTVRTIIPRFVRVMHVKEEEDNPDTHLLLLPPSPEQDLSTDPSSLLLNPPVAFEQLTVPQSSHPQSIENTEEDAQTRHRPPPPYSTTPDIPSDSAQASFMSHREGLDDPEMNSHRQGGRYSSTARRMRDKDLE